MGALGTTAAAISVGRVELRDQFTNHIVDIPTGNCVFEQLAIALAHGLPINAMLIGIVEIVALQPPGFSEELLPLSFRIDHRFQSTDRQLLFKFLALFRLDDGVFTFAPDEHLFSVGGEDRLIYIFEDRFFFTLLDLVIVQRALLLAGTSSRQRPVNELAGFGGQISEIGGLRRQGPRTALEIRYVDLYWLGRF